MGTDYRRRIKRLWQIALAESLKAYALAVIGWVLLYILSQLLNSLDLNSLQFILKLLYLIIIIFLILISIRPVLKTFVKTSYGPAMWMLIFMIINLLVIGLILLWLTLIFTDLNNIIDLIKGPYNVTVYLS